MITVMRTEGQLGAVAWLPDSRGLAVAGALGLYVYDFNPGAESVV
jgi:hypothetical protein